MRKSSVLIATIAALLMALISTPVHANTYNESTGNGTVACVTSGSTIGEGYFTIERFVVIGNTGCTGEAQFPASVTRIGGTTFLNNTSLVAITFDNESLLESIGGNAFQGATALTSVTIPAGVRSIEEAAFSGTTGLRTITLLDGDESLSIGNLAFFMAAAPTINIPSRVSFIEKTALFSDALTSITVADANANYSSQNGALFNKSKTHLYQYPIGRDASSFSIPATVTTIDDYSFTGATKLVSVEIPHGVTSIGSTSFAEATALTSITIPASVTSIGWYAFENATALKAVNFLGNAPVVGDDAFLNVGAGAKALVTASATGFGPAGATWNRLIVEFVAPQIVDTPISNTPTVDLVAQAAAAELASRTIGFKKKYAAKSLAQQTGVPIVSPKAKVTFKVAKSAKKVCTKSGSKLKTLKAGNCIVTFTVQEPKPKKGKKPKATKTVKTFVVQ